MDEMNKKEILQFLCDIQHINTFKSLGDLWDLYFNSVGDISKTETKIKTIPYSKFKILFRELNKQYRICEYSKKLKTWTFLEFEEKKKTEDKCDCGNCEEMKYQEEERFSLGIEFERLLKSFIKEFVSTITKKELSELLKPIVKEELKNAYPDIMKGIKEYIENKYSLETEQTLEQKVRTILKNAF